MLNGRILPKILMFSLPLALSGVLQLLFNAADVIVLGRYVGSDALAAVSSTGSLTGLLTNLFIGISVGVNVVIATYYAAGKYREVSKSVHTAIAVALVSGLLLIILGLAFSEPMLRLMGSPENVLPLSVQYLRIYFSGMPFIMLYNFGSAVLRSIGDTRRPLYYLVIAGVINVCLNLFFVLVLNMGVSGVAIATVSSHCISSLLIIRALIKEDSCLKFSIKKLNLEPGIVIRFAQIGVPAGLQSVLFAVSNVLIQSSVNSFGSIVMAGNGAAASLEGFQYTAMHSVYTGAITFVGQNMGAQKYSRLNKIALNSLLCVAVVGFVFQGVFALFGRELLWFYTTESQVVDAALVRLGVFIMSYWLCGLMDVSSGLMRGMGYGTLPTVVSLLGAVGLRILWLYTVFAANHDYRILLIGYPISWAITFAAHMICYLRARSALPSEDGAAV